MSAVHPLHLSHTTKPYLCAACLQKLGALSEAAERATFYRLTIQDPRVALLT